MVTPPLSFQLTSPPLASGHEISLEWDVTTYAIVQRFPNTHIFMCPFNAIYCQIFSCGGRQVEGGTVSDSAYHCARFDETGGGSHQWVQIDNLNNNRLFDINIVNDPFNCYVCTNTYACLGYVLPLLL